MARRSFDDSLPITPQPPKKANPSQQQAWKHLEAQVPLVCLVGPAGTGKTFIAIAWAAEAIKTGKAHQLVYIRSPLEAGRASLGYIPGTVAEKMAPYTAPLYSIAKKVGIAERAIKIEPTCYVQGMTFEDSIILVDECQNLTIDEFRAVVTRTGKGSTLILAGDPEQDTRDSGGLPKFLNRVEDLDCVRVVYFDPQADNMRHPMIVDVIGALKGAK